MTKCKICSRKVSTEDFIYKGEYVNAKNRPYCDKHACMEVDRVIRIEARRQKQCPECYNTVSIPADFWERGFHD